MWGLAFINFNMSYKDTTAPKNEVAVETLAVMLGFVQIIDDIIFTRFTVVN